jgi:NADH-quinone oxidoreductase subunit M
LAAVYLLWAYQRVFHGEPTVEENRTMLDLGWREIGMLAPIMAMIVLIGVYPKPFLDSINPAAERTAKVLERSSVDDDRFVLWDGQGATIMPGDLRLTPAAYLLRDRD